MVQPFSHSFIASMFRTEYSFPSLMANMTATFDVQAHIKETKTSVKILKSLLLKINNKKTYVT